MEQFQTAVIGKYETALQFSLTYIPSCDAGWDQLIRERLRDADEGIRELGVEGTPEYIAAVQRAERIACNIREQIMR